MYSEKSIFSNYSNYPNQEPSFSWVYPEDPNPTKLLNDLVPETFMDILKFKDEENIFLPPNDLKKSQLLDLLESSCLEQNTCSKDEFHFVNKFDSLANVIKNDNVNISCQNCNVPILDCPSPQQSVNDLNGGEIYMEDGLFDDNLSIFNGFEEENDPMMNQQSSRCRSVKRCLILSKVSDLFLKYFKTVYSQSRSEKNAKDKALTSFEIAEEVNDIIRLMLDKKEDLKSKIEISQLEDFLEDPKLFVQGLRLKSLNLFSMFFVLFYLIKKRKLKKIVKCFCQSEMLMSIDFDTSLKRDDELIKFFFKKHNQEVINQVIPPEKRKDRIKYKKQLFNTLLAQNSTKEDQELNIQNLYNEDKNRKKSNNRKRYKVIKKSIHNYKRNRLTRGFYTKEFLKQSYKTITNNYAQKEKIEKIKLLLNKFDLKKEVDSREFLQLCLDLMKEKKIKTFFEQVDMKKSYDLFKNIVISE